LFGHPKGQNPSIFIFIFFFFSAMGWPNHSMGGGRPVGHPLAKMGVVSYPHGGSSSFLFVNYFLKIFIFLFFFLYSATFQPQRLIRGELLKFGRKI